MGKYVQDPHRLSISTPLGEDALYLVAFEGHEEYSRLFHFRMDMFSDEENIDPAAIVGKNVTLQVEYPDGEPKYFNGFVNRFVNLGKGQRGTQYRAEMVPWLWFLVRSADCFIYQNKTIPEIIEDVFNKFGFSDFETSEIKGSHQPWEYCVQYRETAFNFVSRLMEQEGIFYFFKHEEGKHTLVLSDQAGAYYKAQDDKISFTPDAVGELRRDNVLSWEHQYEYRPGKWTHTDYNFEKPNNTRNPTYEILKADSKTVVELENIDKYEIYDYPGEYEEKSDGEDIIKLRMEEEEVPHDVVSATSICRSFSPGAKFEVDEHRSGHEKGKSYVITSVNHSARVGAYVTGGTAAEMIYTNSFTCVPDSVVLRPARITPKPIIQGSQTAVVVGPAGEEIWPDEYGRVKVQFHWDREGEMDDNSSCWIRTMQNSAGRNWGSMYIPRIGQEVIVSFLEGDPDRPLITGMVYNAGQMPPYELPDHKTRSYIKTNSSKGGEGYNEIRFEDKKDEEQIFIHAQKNMDVRVLNDSMERVINDRHEIIGDDENGKKGSHRQEVFEDKETKIHRHRIEHVEGNLQLTVGKGDADGGNVDLLFEKDKKEHVEGDSHLTIDGDYNQKVGGTLSLETSDGLETKLGGDWKAKSAGSVHIKAGMSLVIEAGSQLSLKVGGNFIDISSAGVAISGSSVLINSGGAAGTAQDASPTEPAKPEKADPTKPDEADDSETGKKSCPD